MMDKYTLYYTTEMIRLSEQIKNSTGMSLAEKSNLIDNMINHLKDGKKKIIETDDNHEISILAQA
jgi:uncharacterized membrane protein YukC